MTKIKQRIVDALDMVDPDEMLTLYSVVCGFAASRHEEIPPPGANAYMRVRKALGVCRGPLADDIRRLRDDRA